MGSGLTPPLESGPALVRICLDRLPNLEVLVGISISGNRKLLINGIFDTGAQVSLLSEKLLKENVPQLLEQMSPCKTLVTGAAGKTIPVVGELTLSCQIGDRNVSQKFIVADVVIPMLLGLDFITRYKASWDWKLGKLVFQDKR